jgi:hypothetical protein
MMLIRDPGEPVLSRSIRRLAGMRGTGANSGHHNGGTKHRLHGHSPHGASSNGWPIGVTVHGIWRRSTQMKIVWLLHSLLNEAQELTVGDPCRFRRVRQSCRTSQHSVPIGLAKLFNVSPRQMDVHLPLIPTIRYNREGRPQSQGVSSGTGLISASGSARRAIRLSSIRRSLLAHP